MNIRSGLLMTALQLLSGCNWGGKYAASDPGSMPATLASTATKLESYSTADLLTAATASGALMVPYGNIYTNTSDVFDAQYAVSIASLLRSATSLGALYADGSLPKDALFNSTPPRPSLLR